MKRMLVNVVKMIDVAQLHFVQGLTCNIVHQYVQLPLYYNAIDPQLLCMQVSLQQHHENRTIEHCIRNSKAIQCKHQFYS